MTTNAEIVSRKRAFLETCAKGTPEIPENTQEIHWPIVDLYAVKGHLNPAGLGNAEEFSRVTGFAGQSAVGFTTVAEFLLADKTGRAPYGGAEYGVVGPPEVEAVCKKMAALHGGAGATLYPSGLNAITRVLDTFAPAVVAFPKDAYSPDERYIIWSNKKPTRQPINPIYYPSRASGEDVENLVKTARRAGTPVDMIYLEAPCSNIYQIPDIDGIIGVGKKYGIRTVMDNSYASNRFKPDVDIVIEALTKYKGGYYDTESGIAIARSAADLELLQETSRATGSGAGLRQTAQRLSHRVDSTDERMDRHYETALKLSHWFQEQPFVADVLNPALETSPDHERFKHYFGKGNGLFTVVFKNDVPAEKVLAFVDGLNLFVAAQSWGGHVSLALPTKVPKSDSNSDYGVAIRFHAGLESADDLIRDLEQSAELAFNYRPAPRALARPRRDAHA